MSVSEATRQIVWLRQIVEDMGEKQDEATILLLSQQASDSNVHHYIREMIDDDVVLIKQVPRSKIKLQISSPMHFHMSSLREC